MAARKNDLVFSEKVGVNLTRESWHVRRTLNGADWAARNAAGKVKTGTADSADEARTKAREHALGG